MQNSKGHGAGAGDEGVLSTTAAKVCICISLLIV